MINEKVMLCIVSGLFWFSQYGFIPHISNYANELGASYNMIGLISGAYGISQTVLRLPLGIASDIFNKRKIFISFGFIASIISTLLVVLYPSIYTLLASRFLSGMAAATWVSFTVMFSLYFSDSESVKASGIINSASKVGQFFAIMLGGFIAISLSIRYIFLACMIAAVIGYVMSFIIKDESCVKDSTPFTFYDLLLIIKNKNVLYVSVLTMLVHIITYGSTFSFTPIIASELGANNIQISMITIAYIFPQIVFSTLTGTILLRKMGENGTLLLGSIFITIVCIATPFSPNLPVLYCIQVINGIGFALSYPLLMGLSIKSVESKLKNTAMGFFQTMQGVGIIIGPILLGFLGEKRGLMSAYLNIGLAGMVCMITMITMKKKIDINC